MRVTAGSSWRPTWLSWKSSSSRGESRVVEGERMEGDSVEERGEEKDKADDAEEIDEESEEDEAEER